MPTRRATRLLRPSPREGNGGGGWVVFRSLRTWSPMSRVVVRALAASVLIACLGALWSPPAGAHTGFESSDPADGTELSTVVDEITLTFTGPAEPAGEGFVVLDPVRGRRQPASVEAVSEGTYLLTFDPPLAGGDVGVRWSVRAPDAHPISGSFRFTVTAAAPATETASDAAGPAEAGASESGSLDDFLDDERTSPAGAAVADVGRFLAMGATMIAVGFLVFCLTVMRGTRRELRMLLFWIRRAGLVIVVGTALDALGQLADQAGGFGALLEPGEYASVFGGTLGLSLLARAGGGLLVAARADLAMVHAHAARDVVRSIAAKVPVGAGSGHPVDREPAPSRDRELAWELDRRGTVALAGFALVVVSHILDGHTVTEGNRWLTGAVSAAHLLAAAVWAGGVAALLLVLRDRWRRDEPTHSLVMVVRYSVVATIALVVVAVAGMYLAVVILDGPSGLWTTEWGRVFMAKLAVVAAAAGLGAHNHHVIVPALEVSEEHPDAVRRLRTTLRKEVVALAGVTVLTAVLVRSASM